MAKNVLITGSSRGIWKSIKLLLDSNGFNLIENYTIEDYQAIYCSSCT